MTLTSQLSPDAAMHERAWTYTLRGPVAWITRVWQASAWVTQVAADALPENASATTVIPNRSRTRLPKGERTCLSSEGRRAKAYSRSGHPTAAYPVRTTCTLTIVQLMYST